MNEIDHGYTDEIVCPYCGAKELDSWEVCPGEEDIGNIECGTCEKTFFAQRIITIQYSTYKIDWLDEWVIYNQNAIYNYDALRKLRIKGYYAKHKGLDR